MVRCNKPCFLKEFFKENNFPEIFRYEMVLIVCVVTNSTTKSKSIFATLGYTVANNRDQVMARIKAFEWYSSNSLTNHCEIINRPFRGGFVCVVCERCYWV